jgi:hypothetical protein
MMILTAVNNATHATDKNFEFALINQVANHED